MPPSAYVTSDPSGGGGGGHFPKVGEGGPINTIYVPFSGWGGGGGRRPDGGDGKL